CRIPPQQREMRFAGSERTEHPDRIEITIRTRRASAGARWSRRHGFQGFAKSAHPWLSSSRSSERSPRLKWWPDYEGGSLLMASHLILPRAGNRRCTPIHADERRKRTSACIRVHRRFQTTALVPFLLYQPCLGPYHRWLGSPPSSR